MARPAVRRAACCGIDMIRELVMGYYEHYYNPAVEKTLRTYSTRPVKLKRLVRMNWITTEEDSW
jgi:hypothetical protein